MLLFSCSLYAQDTTVVASSSYFQFLYHRVPNLVRIGFANMDEPYFLVCSCDKITNIDSLGNALPAHTYFVLPSENWKTIIEVYRLIGEDTVRISEIVFNNISLPNPELCFGATSSEGEFNPEETILILRPSIYTYGMDYHFRILSWSVKIGKKRYSGEKNRLTHQVLNRIKKLKEKSKIEIEVQCDADDGIVRIIRSSFYKGTKIEGEIPDENGNYPSYKE